jgi:glycosyltransferase involved in cell wall biosynthesis
MSRAFIDAGLPKSRLLTIPNGVDIERFCPPENSNEKILLRKELGLPENGTLILFVGFFSKDKGPDILFEAFKNIKGKIKEDLYIIFIGTTKGKYFEIDVSLIKTIKDDIEKFSMQNNIIFIESTLEIEKYYKASDIFVFPSLREGLPNALMEAMSSGLPCISSDLEGIKDNLICNEKEGLIFGRVNINKLSSAICSILEDKNLGNELGIKARKKIVDNFSIDKISKMYDALYKRLYEKA